MKAHVILTALSAGLALCMPVAAAQAPEPPPSTQQPADTPTISASCVLHVTSHPRQLPLNERALGQLVESTGVAGRAVRDVLHVGPEALEDWVHVGFTPNEVDRHVDRRSVVGRLTVEIKPPRPDFDSRQAEALLAAVCTRLKAELATASEQARLALATQVEMTRTQLDAAQQQYERLGAVEKALYDEAGRVDLSRDAILARLRELESLEHRLALQLVAQQARRRATTEQIASISAGVEEKVKTDAVVAELMQVVTLREQQVERMRGLFDMGQADAAQLGQAQEQLAMARAQVAQQRRDASAAAAGNVLAKLNDDLIMLSVETAEAEAQLAHVRSELEKLRSQRVLELADRYEREVVLQRDLLETAVRMAANQLHEAEHDLQGFAPAMVAVLGAGTPD